MSGFRGFGQAARDRARAKAPHVPGSRDGQVSAGPRRRWSRFRSGTSRRHGRPHSLVLVLVSCAVAQRRGSRSEHRLAMQRIAFLAHASFWQVWIATPTAAGRQITTSRTEKSRVAGSRRPDAARRHAGGLPGSTQAGRGDAAAAPMLGMLDRPVPGRQQVAFSFTVGQSRCDGSGLQPGRREPTPAHDRAGLQHE
jgi:hypothetical protein